jgi:hypothetical protein
MRSRIGLIAAVLRLGVLDYRQCYQDHGNESAHRVIMIQSATSGLRLSEL